MPRVCKNSEKPTKGRICMRCRKPLSGIELLATRAWNEDLPSTSTRRRNERKRRRSIKVEKSALLDAVSSGSSDNDNSCYVKKKCPERKLPIKKEQPSTVIIHNNPRFGAAEPRSGSEIRIQGGSNETPESKTVEQKCESELEQDCKRPQQNFSRNSYPTVDVDMQNKAINCNINEETMDGQIVQFVGSSSDDNPLTLINTDASVQIAHLSRSFHFLDNFDAAFIGFIRSLHRIVRSLK